jgi:hypothetical protein
MLMLNPGDRSSRADEALFGALAAQGFGWEKVPWDALHAEYRSPKIEVFVIRLGRPASLVSAVDPEGDAREDEV